MVFRRWYDIDNFHNARRKVLEHESVKDADITYRAKVKLHGTNAGVMITKDGIAAMSRSGFITPERDNAGFARWVSENESVFSRIDASREDVIVYGEWCGEGIQKGVAISNIGKKIYAVFAIRRGESELIVEPSEISEAFDENVIERGVHILPWHGAELAINWGGNTTVLERVALEISEDVNAVELCDPWVKQTFGNEGIGEGLVFYPVSKEHLGSAAFDKLSFKAKGFKHRNVERTAPAQANPTEAKDAEDFATLVVTEQRLLQCLGVTCDGKADAKLLGSFIRWMHNDVEKECVSELRASNVDRKAALRAVSTAARKWFIKRVSNITEDDK